MKVCLLVLGAALVVVGCTSGNSAAALATDRVATGNATVVLRHPSDWRRQLSPQNRHYSEATALFANFDLHDPCTPTNGGQGIGCHDEQMGVFPADGVLVSVGWSTDGPGPHTIDELLAYGTPTTVGGRRAARVENQLETCSGTGATHSVRYMVDYGASSTALSIEFCWRGESPTVAAQVVDAAAKLAIET